MARLPLTPEEVAQVCEMRERGLSEAVIAMRLKCHQSTVGWALLREGVDFHQDRPLPPVPTEPVVQQRGGHLVRRFTAAEDRQLTALEADGLNTNQIAAKLGRRHNSVVGRMRTLARREARAEAQGLSPREELAHVPG